MKITALEYDSRRDRMMIITDSGEDFAIGFGEFSARKSLYRVGEQLESELLEITQYLQSRTLAREKALKTLSYSSKTAKALMRTLTDAGFDADIAKQTVLDIKKEGYIDEKDFCRRCTELLVRKGYGPSRIRSELYKKGFTQRMIDYTMEKDQTDFLELLRSQMRKKSGKVDYGSIYRYFYSRGYDGAMIGDVYREIFD